MGCFRTLAGTNAAPRGSLQVRCSACIQAVEPILDVMEPGVSSDDRGDGTVPPMPRWVKLLALAAIVLIVVVVILHLTGNGFGGHGLPH